MKAVVREALEERLQLAEDMVAWERKQVVNIEKRLTECIRLQLGAEIAVHDLKEALQKEGA